MASSARPGSILCPILLCLLLLTDSYCKTALLQPARTRRQTISDSEPDSDIASFVSNFLQADPDTQQDYLRYGVELAEYHLLQSYDGIKDKTDAQDRVFLDSVQSLINAVQSISSDPGQTPAALAALATNPGNLLLFTSLVVSTVFVAQLSSLALFGTSLSGASLQDTEGAEEATGLLGMVMGILAVFPNLLTAITDFITSITQENRVIDIEYEESGNCTNSLFPCSEAEDYEDTVDDTKVEDAQEEEEGQSGGLLDPLINFIHNFVVIRQTDDGEVSSDEVTEPEEVVTEGSGSEEDGGIHLGVNVASGSILDMIVNLMPIPDVNELEEETIQEVTEPEVSEPEVQGTTTFGGASISLHPIDLARLFIQMQNIIGVNCTCDDALTDDAITQATLKLVEENMEQANRFRQYSGLKDPVFDGGSSGKKKGRKGGGKRRVSGRVPKSLY